MAIGTRRQPYGEALGRLAFFHGADPGLRAKAAPFAAWLTPGPGEPALEFGDESQDVFLIVEGEVRALIPNAASGKK